MGSPLSLGIGFNAQLSIRLLHRSSVPSIKGFLRILRFSFLRATHQTDTHTHKKQTNEQRIMYNL